MIQVEPLNAPEFERRVAGVAERMAFPGVAFGLVMRELEHREESVFASYEGKYVETGALEASLTQSAATGAIRRLYPSGAEFGSALPYAGFQGTQGVGDHRGPSALLRAKPEDAEFAARTLLEYVLHGGRL